MKKIFFILSIVVLLCPAMAKGQTLSNKDRRYINTKVLGLIEEYERVATVHDEEAEYCFLNLFLKEDSPVLCDMIGLPSYMTKISASEYMKLVQASSGATSMVISDVKKGEFTYSDGKWIIPVTFRKNVSYMDQLGYAFSIGDYYGENMSMSMTLVYDPVSDICRIESIDGVIDSKIKFPEGRFTIVNKPTDTLATKDMKFIRELKADGKPISYNAFGQAFVSAVDTEVSDIDVTVLVDTVARGLNYDVVDFDILRRNTRVKLRYGIAPLGAYNVTTAYGVLADSQAMEFGVDLGTTWSAGKSAKMGLFFGINISRSNLTLSLKDPIKYLYKTSVLGDQGLYNKLNYTFDIASAQEQVDFTDLMVPLYLETEHRIGNYVLLSWNVGVKAYCNLKATCHPFEMTGNLSISDEFGGKDTQAIALDNMYMAPATYRNSPIDVSLMANLGVDINLYRKMFYLSMRAGYEYGLNYISQASEANFYNMSTGLYPVVYNPMKASFTAMHSFLRSTSYRRQALWFEFGLKFKM